MHLKKNTLILWSLAALLLMIAAACRSGEQTARSPRGGKAVIALPGTAGSLFPLTIKSYDIQEISAHLLSPALTRSNAEGDVVPVLVKGWQTDNARQRIIYYLDEKRRWSDGRPLLAEDVWRSWRFIRRHRDKVNPQYRFSRIDTCIIRDSLTVIFKFNRPVARPAQLTRFPIFPGRWLHSLSWDSVYAAYDSAFIGCGPFILAAREARKLSLKRNPAGTALLAGLDIRFYDGAERLRELLSKRLVDLAPDVSEDVSRAFKRKKAYRTEYSGERGFTFIAWNLRSRRVVDLRLRKALTLGLDRATIADGLLGNLAVVHDAPTYPGFRDFLDTTAYRYQPEAARRLLDQTGSRHKLTLLVNSENALRLQLAQNIKSYWDLLGVTTEIRSLPWDRFLAALQKGHYDAALISWVQNDVFNPTDLFGSGGIKKGNNFMYYRNDEVDNALMAALTAARRKAQRMAWYRFQRAIIRDMPVTVLFSKRIATLISNRLKNVKIDASGYLNNPRDWWLDPAPDEIFGEQRD